MKQLHHLNIRSLKYLAAQIGIAADRLEDLSHRTDHSYRKFEKISPEGKRREFRDPHPQLKDVQRRIDRRILKRLHLPPEIHGSRPGHSPKTLARLHIRERAVLSLDIKDFFPSIRPNRVRRLFEDLGCSPEVCKMLTRLTTHENQLPQGAPTSPTLANLIMVASGLPERLDKLARAHGLNLGFYLDDILLSGSIEPERLKRLLVRIVAGCGFQISHEKLGKGYARLAHQRQEGLGMTLNRKLNAPKCYVRRLRATLHACRTEGPGNRIPSGKSCEQFRESLHGQISYVRSLNPRMADRLLVEFKKISWDEAEASHDR